MMIIYTVIITVYASKETSHNTRIRVYSIIIMFREFVNQTHSRSLRYITTNIFRFYIKSRIWPKIGMNSYDFVRNSNISYFLPDDGEGWYADRDINLYQFYK